MRSTWEQLGGVAAHPRKVGKPSLGRGSTSLHCWVRGWVDRTWKQENHWMFLKQRTKGSVFILHRKIANLFGKLFAMTRPLMNGTGKEEEVEVLTWLTRAGGRPGTEAT